MINHQVSIAYKLLLSSLADATSRIISDYGRDKGLKKKMQKAKIQEAVEGEFSEALFEFNDNFLLNPAEHPLVLAYIPKLKAFLKELKISDDQLFGLEEKLKSYYFEAFHRIYSDSRNQGEFSKLANALINETTPAFKREWEWDNYRSKLIHDINKPIFDEAFSLNQIYVPLNGYYEIPDSDKEKEKLTIVCKLREEFDNWLENKDPKDTLRIISGDPGAGKSTFAKKWSATLARGDSSTGQEIRGKKKSLVSFL